MTTTTSKGWWGASILAKPLHAVSSSLWLLLAAVAQLYPRQMTPTTGKTTKLHPTAYLDALRGYAAIPVALSHLHEGAIPPRMTIAMNGKAMVDTFFIISGFALSYSALGYIHKQQPERFLDSLASSTFRRYFRLFLPTAFATFIAMLVLATGLGKHGGGGPNAVQPTFAGNVWFWVCDTVQNSNPFVFVSTSWMGGGSHGSAYLLQLWTICVEFKASMVVFLFLVAVCKMKPWARTITITAGVVLSIWWNAAYAGLFLFGMLLADNRQWRANAAPQLPSNIPDTSISAEESPPTEKIGLDDDSMKSEASFEQTSSPPAWRLRTYKGSREIPYFALFAAGIYLLTSPTYGSLNANSPWPFNWLTAVAPPSYDAAALEQWPLILSSMAVCYALENSPALRRPLLTPISQWLGELSFGIYVMHITVRYIVWDTYFRPWQTAVFGEERLRYFSAWLPAFFVMSILVAWAAEGFRRVDQRCVEWSKMLSRCAFI